MEPSWSGLSSLSRSKCISMAPWRAPMCVKVKCKLRWARGDRRGRDRHARATVPVPCGYGRRVRPCQVAGCNRCRRCLTLVANVLL